MKVFLTVLKIVAVLAAIAGIVYAVAAYGDKMVAWAKKVLRIDRFRGCCDDDFCFDDEIDAEVEDFEG